MFTSLCCRLHLRLRLSLLLNVYKLCSVLRCSLYLYWSVFPCLSLGQRGLNNLENSLSTCFLLKACLVLLEKSFNDIIPIRSQKAKNIFFKIVIKHIFKNIEMKCFFCHFLPYYALPTLALFSHRPQALRLLSARFSPAFFLS